MENFSTISCNTLENFVREDRQFHWKEDKTKCLPSKGVASADSCSEAQDMKLSEWFKEAIRKLLWT